MTALFPKVVQVTVRWIKRMQKARWHLLTFIQLNWKVTTISLLKSTHTLLSVFSLHSYTRSSVIYWHHGSQSVVPRLAASASSGNLLQKQMLGLYPDQQNKKLCVCGGVLRNLPEQTPHVIPIHAMIRELCRSSLEVGNCNWSNWLDEHKQILQFFWS